MKALQALSRTRNAKDTKTMTTTPTVILSEAKNILSDSRHGRRVDSSLSLRMTTAGFALTAIAAGLLFASNPAQALNECGPGPTVVCTGNFTATGIAYNFSTDLSVTLQTTGTSPIQRAMNAGVNGIKLIGTGDADLNLVTNNLFRITGTGGLSLQTDTGNITADFGPLDPGGSIQPSIAGPLRVITNGLATLNFTSDGRIENLDLSPGATGSVVVNNSGRIGSSSTTTLLRGGSGAGSVTINNNGRIRGFFDFSLATGAVTIINNTDRPLGTPANGGWNFSGTNVFGSGNDQVINSATATLMAAAGGGMDFGAGDDRLVNDGRFIVGEGFAPAGAVTLTNLERFENNGLLIMGATYSQGTDLGQTSNLQPGTRLIAQGVDFVASENSRIALDVALAETMQLDCSAAPAADCFDFSGGTTSGTTVLSLSDARPAAASAAFNEGIVLIEGASAAEHFVLDPNSRGYVANTTTGPAIQKGLVTYRFTYDETAKQHKLTGVLADEGAQGGTFMASAQEIWRTTTDTWFDRQAALRAKPKQAGSESGLWSTVNMSTGERDFVASNAIGANSYDYNLKQDQQITHLAFGGDFINAGGLSFGGMAGYVYSTVDYDATKLQSEIGGFQAGLYGSYLAGPISVDALVNYNLATQSLEATNLGLGPDTQIRTDLTSIGGRVDAGWRLSFGDAFYLQPLLGVAYVTTTIDDLELPSGGGSFEFDGTSLRAGAGLRMGLELPTGGLKTSFDLTGRWWNEMDGENDTVVTIPNGNTEVPLTDEFNGGFSEVAAGVNLASAGSTGFSGFVTVKSKFASEYSTLGASAGFRYQW